MVGKKLVVILFAAIGLAFLASGCTSKKEVETASAISEPEVKHVAKENSVKPKLTEKKYDLYSSTAYDLPLFSIIEISKFSPELKAVVDNIFNASQGFYFLKSYEDKLFIILQNPVVHSNTYYRHNLQFAEVDLNGRVKYHTAGYAGIDGETNIHTLSKEDEWFIDENFDTFLPQKHIAYDEKGKIKFVEIWNHETEDVPSVVRYQMLDADKKVVSILRESQDNSSNYRKEHVFYDNNGQTTMSLSVNYDNANISRMTFYNSHDSIDSVTIISEYTDGLKTKEFIYNEDYELIYTVIAEYINGERVCIKLFDKDGKEIIKIKS